MNERALGVQKDIETFFNIKPASNICVASFSLIAESDYAPIKDCLKLLSEKSELFFIDSYEFNDHSLRGPSLRVRALRCGMPHALYEVVVDR